MKSKEELKKLFENGDRPTQKEFWEWQDSYWHKEEKLPTENEGNYRIKGSVANLDALNAVTNMLQGDVYNLLETGDNYVYVLDLNNTGVAGWDQLSGIVDLSSINLQTVLENGNTAINPDNQSSIVIDLRYNTFLSRFLNGVYSSVIDQNTRSIAISTKDNIGESMFSQSGSNIYLTSGISGDLSAMVKFNANNLLTYIEDYSDRFTERSLVDKAYVDTATASTGSGNYIPLTGTENEKPITGDIISNSVFRAEDYSFRIGSESGRPLITTNHANSTNSSSFKSYVEGFEVQLQRKRDTPNPMFQSIQLLENYSIINHNNSSVYLNEGYVTMISTNTINGDLGEIKVSNDGSVNLKNVNNGAEFNFNLGVDGSSTDGLIRYLNDYSNDFNERTLVDKAYVDASFTRTEDIEITDSTKGIILTSPIGNRFRVTVADDGTLTTTAFD
ncbi:hypothetical protein [Chryseobacterium sp. 8AT]|uniref:hypothetical protein n=1 Tax=Chryseobacterium sp. 8AT TaxID=2653134 RepID=UPI0012F45CA9|nr:hypothetical protein [Chryseobacterium sp. 8AT]VXB17162.1 conserved hypothetical protein [Chryseobacterium sp. 8AT]